jgi:hypothetical protein
MFAKVRSTIPSSAAASVEIWMWREYSASMSKVFCGMVEGDWYSLCDALFWLESEEEEEVCEGHGVFGEK